MKKRKFSKILLSALILSSIGVSSSLPVFAANTVYNSGDNWIGSDYVDATHTGTAITTKKTITVTNVNDRRTGVVNSAAALDVVAYQLVKGQYKDGKLTSYVLCDATNASIADMEHPTVAEITTIANNVRAGTTTLNGIHMTAGTGAQSNQYTASVEAGLYIVLVSGAGGYVYNPAVVAVNIGDANDVAGDDTVGGSVDLASYWNIPTNAYLKSGTSNFNKDIIPKFGGPVEGDTVDIGDTVYFKLDGMTIPTYTDEYARPNGTTENGVIYKIEDKLQSNSFAGISNFRVNVFDHVDVGAGGGEIAGDDVIGDVGGNAGDPQDYSIPAVDDNNTPDDTSDDIINYTVVFKDKNGNIVTGNDIAKSAVSYTLQFTDAWLRAHAYKDVTITYNTNLIETADINGAANKTVAALSYTVDPSNNTGVEILRDSTYHYTFGIGDEIDGEGSDKGYEVNKVTQALGADEEYAKNNTSKRYYGPHALAGAQFTLYDDDDFTTVHQMYSRNSSTLEWEAEDAVYTTDSDGNIMFSGLDEGTYYLKETAAPDGYTLNDNDYKIIIAATLDDGTTGEEGTLTGYTVDVYVWDATTNAWVACGDAVYAIDPTVTKPTTDANAMNFDNIVNDFTGSATNPAEVVDTPLATLPSTGGAGTIALTLVSATGMGAFFTLYMINKKKKKNSEK